MGKILPSYKKAIIDELVGNISSYYAFGANPIAYDGIAPIVTNDDYSTTFINNWQMLFGKKLQASDIAVVIKNNIWTPNTVYERYDNTSNTVIENNNYYAISSPTFVGGSYHVYKCIDNAGGAESTVDPASIGTPTQPFTFETSDKYKWRYIYSISSANYDKFSSEDYVPVYSNSIIISTASNYSGVEVVNIKNGGNGYATYTNGVIQSVQNNSLIQIENSSSENSGFYVNNGIYIYNTFSATSQLRNISLYVSNTSGKWVYLNSPVNTEIITPSATQYIISPQVYFDTDGDSPPKAYSIINTTSNSISSIVVLDIGSNISRANAHIISNTSFGSGASVSCIVPPAGGHGSDPASELNVQGFALTFNFSNTQSNTILTSNAIYNKIGLLKNPYQMDSNGNKGSVFSSNTFSQVLKANTNPVYTFNTGETVTGVLSGAKGIVVFANSTQVYLSGDKKFIDGELVANAAGSQVTTISIQTRGDIYTKDLKPIYVQNINNVNRLDDQTETFKLIIKV
jgi:hypothetical protein